MPKVKDLTGIKVGKLLILKANGRDSYSRCLWECACDCGNMVTRKASILSDAIKKEKQSHCGCSSPRKTHGLTKGNKRLYWIWASMVQRCENPKNKDYYNYGARGISIFKPWRDNFGAFHEWAMQNGYKEGLSIERIDNENGYNPDNCCFITMPDQAKNQRDCLYAVWDGQKRSLSELSEISGINYRTLKQRIFKLGWSIEKAMTKKPILGTNQHS